MEIYRMEVVRIGDEARKLLDSRAMITFVSEAPPELIDFSVLVHPGEFRKPLEPGDRLLVDQKEFPILAVGAIANKNLKEIAHAVWLFDGKDKVEMPGEVHLIASDLPEITTGMILLVKRPMNREAT
jgi:PTS system glucitol/sorbitol-specific IIA component